MQNVGQLGPSGVGPQSATELAPIVAKRGVFPSAKQWPCEVIEVGKEVNLNFSGVHFHFFQSDCFHTGVECVRLGLPRLVGDLVHLVRFFGVMHFSKGVFLTIIHESTRFGTCEVTLAWRGAQKIESQHRLKCFCWQNQSLMGNCSSSKSDVQICGAQGKQNLP